jgi:hypothetical protein
MIQILSNFDTNFIQSLILFILILILLILILIPFILIMTDNKLYTVLTYFDKIEQNRLRKYIRSPYFNVNETLMDYFDMIIEYINKSEKMEKNGKNERRHKKNELTKEAVWKNLFKNEPLNDMRFRKLGSELLKLVEGYLAQEVYANKPLQQVNYLFEAIGQKKIEKLYSSTESNARLISTQQHQKPADFYYYQYLIEKNYYESLDVDAQRGEKSNVENIIGYLDEFFLAEKLKWYLSLLSRQSLVTHEYKLLFIDEIIEHLKKHSYEYNASISVYFQALILRVENEKEEHYYNFIELLKKYESQFAMNELYQLYTEGINYCIQQLNQGKSKFIEEHHILYKMMLENGVAFHASKNKEISPWHFKNAVLSALRLGKYEWTEAFINNSKDKLPNEFRENAVSYNLGLVYFYQKKFDKVKEQLREVEYEDISYSLGSKSMLIAIYYEEDDFEALFSLCDTFRTYLNRHKDITERIRNPYLQYISFIKKLTKVTTGDKKTIEQIRQEIKDAKGVASEKWLLEKLAELE